MGDVLMGKWDDLVIWKTERTAEPDVDTAPVRRAYRNPTEDQAIAHIMREEKMKRKKQQAAKRPRNRERRKEVRVWVSRKN